MFSFERGRPIAIVKGGANNGKVLRLFVPTTKEREDLSRKVDKELFDPLEVIYSREFYKITGHKRPNALKMDKLKRAIIKNIEPLEEDLYNIYVDAMSTISQQNGKEFLINSGEMIQLPNIETRECIYISAPSGAGKSTYARHYIQQYQELFPDNKIFVFSRDTEDPALDDLNISRIAINTELVTDPIDKNELKNSLVLFDDTDTIPDEEQKKAVASLRNDLLETARKGSTYVINTSHQITNFKHTKVVLNESQTVTFFPQSSGTHGIKYFLDKYCGLGKKEIEKILKLPSRWVTVSKCFPMYVLYSGGAFLLSNV
jgi:hypothetical protein